MTKVTRFQSLIGRLKTRIGKERKRRDTNRFQSLIGRLKTIHFQPRILLRFLVSIPYR